MKRLSSFRLYLQSYCNVKNLLETNFVTVWLETLKNELRREKKHRKVLRREKGNRKLHRRCQRPPKVLGTNKTMEAT